MITNSVDPQVSEKASRALNSTISVQYTRQPLPSFMSQQEEQTPSITTIERAAATKAAIELQYKGLLCTPSPREVRRQAFDRDLAWKNISKAEKGMEKKSWYEQESFHLRQMRALKTTTIARSVQDFSAIDGFDVVRVLGRGSFGTVRLISQKVESGDLPVSEPEAIVGNDGNDSEIMSSTSRIPPLYALKVIRKPGMLLNCQEGHVRAERDFLAQSEVVRSPWIVSLFGAFQDNTSLYLVMEFMVGGDFLGVLLREEVLHEDMHRDIKPDNFLVGSDGHLKISDFGLAFDGNLDHCQSYYASKRQQLLEKFGISVMGNAQDIAEAVNFSPQPTVLARGLGLTSPKPSQPDLHRRDSLLFSFESRRKYARSVVGTSQYMAPEVILGAAYDGRCDWWSLGILVYKMFYGHTPFYDENRQRTKENIAAYDEVLEFPVGLRYGRPNSQEQREYATASDIAVDFMQSLLTDRDQRLGASAYQYPELGPRRHDSVLGVQLSETKHVKSFDADEVKSHAFFAGVQWSVMHLRRPPWIPSVQPGQPWTKYFEDEPEIIEEEEFVQKRSRDKILRDPELGPFALKERRRTAFIGYTYRGHTADHMRIPTFQRPRGDAILSEMHWKHETDC